MEKLKTDYIPLAEFISDRTADRIKVDWNLTADANCEINKPQEDTAETEGMEEVVLIQKDIADEGAQLLKEINDYIAGINLER